MKEHYNFYKYQDVFFIDGTIYSLFALRGNGTHTVIVIKKIKENKKYKMEVFINEDIYKLEKGIFTHPKVIYKYLEKPTANFNEVVNVAVKATGSRKLGTWLKNNKLKTVKELNELYNNHIYI